MMAQALAKPPSDVGPVGSASDSAVRATAPLLKTILVADDDDTIRNLIAAVLARRGYAVRTAADGAAGLAVMGRRPVDLLITDIEMPICGGLELAGRVRRVWPQLPIIFISGGTLELELPAAMLGGHCNWLAKPFSFAELMDNVEELLARSDAQKQPALATG